MAAAASTIRPDPLFAGGGAGILFDGAAVRDGCSGRVGLNVAIFSIAAAMMYPIPPAAEVHIKPQTGMAKKPVRTVPATAPKVLTA